MKRMNEEEKQLVRMYWSGLRAEGIDTPSEDLSDEDLLMIWNTLSCQQWVLRYRLLDLRDTVIEAMCWAVSPLVRVWWFVVRSFKRKTP